jgi:hypothetical protein
MTEPYAVLFLGALVLVGILVWQGWWRPRLLSLTGYGLVAAAPFGAGGLLVVLGTRHMPRSVGGAVALLGLGVSAFGCLVMLVQPKSLAPGWWRKGRRLQRW